MERITSASLDHTGEAWREQDLALFARRAHRQLGRGFVLLMSDDERPIYVTWLLGAPLPLLDAVYRYDPEHEALLVANDDDESEVFVVSCVRIATRH